MPAILERCVQHVMGKGQDQSSAWAICRSQLGLLADGSEDASAPDMTDEQLQAKMDTALTFQNGPGLIKWMTATKPIGKFVNGPQAGILDVKRIDALIANFKKHPRQVPIYLELPHEDAKTKPPAQGWVEAVKRSSGDLMVRANLKGPAAKVVGGDQVRLASIGTKQEKAYDGTPIGEVLDHLVITNKSYIKDMNIAAADRSGDGLLIYLTDFREAKMAKDGTDTKDLTLAEIEAKHVEEIKAKDDTILDLQKKNLDLTAEFESVREQLDNVKADPELDELKLTVSKQQRTLDAQEIIMLVEDGLQRGVLKAAWCANYRDRKKGYEATHSWFKASRWEGKLELLKHDVLKGEALYRVGKIYSAGSPPEDAEVNLTQADKDQIAALGHDPEEVLAVMKGGGYKDFKAAVAKKE